VNLGRLFLALAAATAVAGLLVAVRPSLAGGLSPTYVVVTAVGVLGLVQAVGVGYSRLRGQRLAATPTRVERPRSFPTPGGEFDRGLGGLPRLTTREADRERAVVRERLRETALAVLTRYEGYDRAAAERALDRGTWTDDPEAAAFFAPDTAEEAFTDRIRDAVAAERAFVRRAGAVTAVLDARVTEGRPTRADRDPPGDQLEATNGHAGADG
jgi:hypothetical protein